MNLPAVIRLLNREYPDGGWPQPFNLLRAARQVRAGTPVGVAARAEHTSVAALRTVMQSKNELATALGLRSLRVERLRIQRTSLLLGQLLVGRCAEIAFEAIYKSELGDRDFELQDERESKTDTDYRLLNGSRRPIYRINIKFHGSQFRRAPELVGLAAEDCFALATYKIYSALRKQEGDALPYLFLIVGVPNLRAEEIGARIPSELRELCALFSSSPKAKGKRAFEDWIVETLVRDQAPVYLDTLNAIGTANWYVLSARRAHLLLRDKLFDRAYALRIRGFAQQFRSAELDMHFSLTEDLTPLREFLATLRDDGLQKATTLTERGDI